MRFRDRRDAGQRLAEVLGALDLPDDVLVLALPRGGVPVAAPIARALDAPLDVLVVRKLGVPGHEELAFGAIASGGVSVLDEHLVRTLRISADDIERVIEAERAELQRRDEVYRGARATPNVGDRTIVLVDDGLATGATMTAAVDTLRAAGARRLIVAVPVGAPDTVASIAERADHVACLLQPPEFGAVGSWYEDFSPTSDDEVLDALGE